MKNNNYNLAIIAVVAALGVLGVIAAPLVTIPLQQAEAAAGKAATTNTINDNVPIDVLLSNFCSSSNETIHVSGQLHVLYHETITSSGAVRGVTQLNTQDITARGVATGDKYIVKETIVQGSTLRVGHEATFVANFRIIDAGKEADFLIQSTVHETVNADGTLTATVDNFRVVCK